MKRYFIPILLLSIFVTTTAFASNSGQQQTDLDTMLEALRADVRSDKVAIVTEAMKLMPGEVFQFWAVYEKYDLEVTKLSDERFKIVKGYADNFASLTNRQAKGLVEGMFAWEFRRTQLRKTYFAEFAKATSVLTAAKFFQVEHRLDLLVDLVIASEVPGLFLRTAEESKR